MPSISSHGQSHDKDLDEIRVVEGVVGHGERRSRQWGFPTANLAAEGLKVDEGIYAGIVRVPSGSGCTAYVAAISVGDRPTYGPGGERLLEAHLLGFRGDMYGARIHVELRSWLRRQHIHPDTASLVRQLYVDVTHTKAWALRHGFRKLLPGDVTAEIRWQRDRWGQRQRVAVRDETTADLRRALRREESIHSAIRGAPQHAVDHELVSAVTGLPVGYLKWRYPTIEDLRAVAGD
jgi:riboflavin kinase/FMN adenylyltransferase